MRLRVCIFILTLGCWASAESIQFNISEISLKSGESGIVKGVCSIPQLTSQQLYIFDEIRKIHVAETQKTRSLLAKQESAYKEILNDKRIQTTRAADDIASKYFKTKYSLSKGQTNFFHAVLYKVLLQSQRASLIRCL